MNHDIVDGPYRNDTNKALATLERIRGSIVIPDLQALCHVVDDLQMTTHNMSGTSSLVAATAMASASEVLHDHLSTMAKALFDIERIPQLLDTIIPLLRTASEATFINDVVAAQVAAESIIDECRNGTALGGIDRNAADESGNNGGCSGDGNETIADNVVDSPNDMEQATHFESDTDEVASTKDTTSSECPSDSDKNENRSTSNNSFTFVDGDPIPDDTKDEPPADAVDEDQDVDVATIFAGELQELLDEAMTLFPHWIDGSNRAASIQRLERIAHTIKGSAAQVGLMVVSVIGKDMQDHLGKIIGNANAEIDHVALTTAIRGFADIATAGKAKWIDPPVTSATSESIKGIDASAVFEEELIAISSQTEVYVRELGSQQSFDRISAAYHRIKGSALVVGRTDLASKAAVVVDAARARDAARVRDAIAIFHGKAIVSQKASVSEGALEVFRIEASEILPQIAQAALSASKSAADSNESIAETKRHLHTLKGSSGSVGLIPLSKSIHLMEDMLDQIDMSISPAATSRVLRTWCQILDNAIAQNRPIMVEELEKSLKPNAPAATKHPENITSARFDSSPLAQRPRQPKKDDTDETDHPSRGTGSPSHGSHGPGSRGKTGSRSGASGSSIDEAARRFIRVPVKKLNGLMDLTGELVVNRSRMMTVVESLDPMMQQLATGRQRLDHLIASFSKQHEFTLVEHAVVASKGNDPATRSGFTSIELDEYTDANIMSRQLQEAGSDIAEAQRQIMLAIGGFADEASGFGRLVSNLQDSITKARLVSISGLIDRLHLPAMEASDHEQKKVSIATTGVSIEIDKTIADDLYAPLLHIVRNAVSHGIESPDKRASAGKPAMGTVSIACVQESGSLTITVSDDGAGIDVDKLMAIGIERRLIPHDISRDDPRVLELIFASGVSTKDEATAISGRGIGGDVVKREVTKLGGTVSISTKRGIGTDIVIQVPVNVSIIGAVIIEIGDERYAIPSTKVVSVHTTKTSHIEHVDGASHIVINRKRIPLISLGLVLDSPSSSVNQQEIIVVKGRDGQVAIAVDRIARTDEIVVKQAGSILAKNKFLAGFSIAGDGKIIVIIDTDILVSQRTRRDLITGGSTVGAKVPIAAPQNLSNGWFSQRQGEESIATQTAVGEVVTLPVDGSQDCQHEQQSASSDSSIHSPAVTENESFSFVEDPIPATVQESAKSNECESYAATSGTKESEPLISTQMPEASIESLIPVQTPENIISDNISTSCDMVSELAKVNEIIASISGENGTPSQGSAMGPTSGSGERDIVPTTSVIEKGGRSRKNALESKKITVIFIDDSLSARTMAKKYLVGLGHHVLLAVDGEDGMRQIRSNPHIDIIFTDLEMPKVNGFQLVESIKASTELASLPIVMITSRTGEKHRDRAFEVGVDSYLGKPFTKDMLEAEIKRFVKR